MNSYRDPSPAGWDFERRREYFTWARRVVDGLNAPSPMLKAEFESTFSKFDGL